MRSDSSNFKLSDFLFIAFPEEEMVVHAFGVN